MCLMRSCKPSKRGPAEANAKAGGAQTRLVGDPNYDPSTVELDAKNAGKKGLADDP